MRKNIEIVKVQTPIFGGTLGMCLVYDKKRKHTALQPLESHVKEALDGDVKGYFNAAWSSIVGWGISGRVEDQAW